MKNKIILLSLIVAVVIIGVLGGWRLWSNAEKGDSQSETKRVEVNGKIYEVQDYQMKKLEGNTDAKIFIGTQINK